MGIANFLESEQKKNKTTEQKSDRPMEPCSAGCTPPYGKHFWKDSYGNWNCTSCRTPATMVLVRDIQDLNFVWSQQNGDGAGLASIPPAELFRIADGFSITAVIPLGNGARPIFNPSTTQAERRGIVESLAWFDRVDARAKVSLQ